MPCQVIERNAVQDFDENCDALLCETVTPVHIAEASKWIQLPLHVTAIHAKLEAQFLVACYSTGVCLQGLDSLQG